MVGTRIVLSPHEYFQFDQTLKNVVVNSESAFWDIFGFPQISSQDLLGWHGILDMPILPLVFPINRGEEAAPYASSLLSHTHAI